MNVVTELKPVQNNGSQNCITVCETTELKCGLDCLEQQRCEYQYKHIDLIITPNITDSEKKRQRLYFQ